MSKLEPRQGELTQMAGIIERLAGELGLSEEPAGFETALEEGAPKTRDE